MRNIRLFVNEAEVDLSAIFHHVGAAGRAIAEVWPQVAGPMLGDAGAAVAAVELAAAAPSPATVIEAVKATVAAVKEAAPIVKEVAAAWRGRGMGPITDADRETK